MLDGELAAGTNPRPGMLAAECAGIKGLRLLDGGFIVTILRAGKAAEVRIVAHGLFPLDAGRGVRLEYGLPFHLLIGGRGLCRIVSTVWRLDRSRATCVLFRGQLNPVQGCGRTARRSELIRLL